MSNSSSGPDGVSELSSKLLSAVVIGGGFAGMQSALRLRKKFDSVTLIDAKQYFEYTPGMHRPFIDPSSHEGLVFDYAEVCGKADVQFVWGYVTSLEDGAVVVRSGSSDDDYFRVSYDYCIVAVGCQYGLEISHPNRDTLHSQCLWYPSISGLGSGPRKPLKKSTLYPEYNGYSSEAYEGTPASAQSSHSSVEDAEADQPQYDERTLEGRRTHVALEQATLRRLNEERAHVAVIGAGFVGVEVVTELKTHFPQLEITLVERREAAVSSMPPRARDYTQRQLDRAGIRCIYDVDYLEVMRAPNAEGAWWSQRGLSYPVRFYMATGIRPHADFMPVETKMRGGWIKVNEYMQVMGDASSHPAFGGRVFAAGNCVGDVPGVGRLPKNVFPAEHMAAFASANLLKLASAEDACRSTGCTCTTAEGRMTKISNPWPGSAACALSLGPMDGVFAFTGEDKDSGYSVMTGRAVILQKETIRWSKLDEFQAGLVGRLLWSVVGH